MADQGPIPKFPIGSLVKYRDGIFLVNGITMELGFNSYNLIDMNTGATKIGYAHELSAATLSEEDQLGWLEEEMVEEDNDRPDSSSTSALVAPHKRFAEISN